MLLLRPIQRLRLLCACCCRRRLAAPPVVGMKAPVAASPRLACAAADAAAGGPRALTAVARQAVEARSSVMMIGTTAGRSAGRGRCRAVLAAPAPARLRVLGLLGLLLLLVRRQGNPGDGCSRIQRMPATACACCRWPVLGGCGGSVLMRYKLSARVMYIEEGRHGFRERGGVGASQRTPNGRTDAHDPKFMHSNPPQSINHLIALRRAAACGSRSVDRSIA